MYNKQDIIELTQEIIQSKKYKNLYRKTIERVVAVSLGKYGKKQAEKRAKKLLHQIWGAYYGAQLNFKKLLTKFERDIKEGRDLKESLLPILALQSSTYERRPLLNDFYQKIFSITGYPNSIIDHACGLNPLTIFWMGLSQETRYRAFDIDKEQVNFLRSIFKLISPESKVEISLGDILVDEFDYADVVFMLKLLPCLEHQNKGISLQVMKRQKCQYLVISFPVRSLSGKRRGMIDFYTTEFQDLIKGEHWIRERILFETELVFVVKK